MARYTLPYAPFELLAFACPLALYLDARQRSPPRRGGRRGSRLGGCALLVLGRCSEACCRRCERMLTRHRILIALLALMATAALRRSLGSYWRLADRARPPAGHEGRRRPAPAPARERAGRPPRRAARTPVVRPPVATPAGPGGARAHRRCGLLIYALLGADDRRARDSASRGENGQAAVRQPPRRHYERYPINLTMHDEAKPQGPRRHDRGDRHRDPPAAADTVAQRPAVHRDRADYARGPSTGWSGCSCSRASARRARRSRGSSPRPTRTCGSGGASTSGKRRRRGAARARLRAAAAKAPRIPVSAVATDRAQASRAHKPSSPLEGIARAQVAAGTPSTVRFQLMPVIDGLERRYRQRLHREKSSSAPRVGRARGPLTLSAGAEIASGGRGAGPRAVSPRAAGGRRATSRPPTASPRA